MRTSLIAAVDLGGTMTKIAFINTNGDVVVSWQVPTDVSDHGKRIITNIAQEIKKKLLELSMSKGQLLGVGVGAPGPFSEDGVMYTAVNLGWENDYPLKALLEQELDLPVRVENDANCAALGEMWKGAGGGAKNLVCVTLGTGVGGGVIANGQIVRGAYGAAGEIGHMTVMTENGLICNCGKSGCLETVASATGVVRLASQQIEATTKASLLRTKQSFSAKDVFEAAKKGDEIAEFAVDRCSFYLGLALSHLGNTLNPDVIVIGGGVSKAGEPLLQSVRQTFNEFAFTPVRNSTRIHLATLGNEAGVIGAAWLIKQKNDSI
ncbi:ROK family glucokinase [Bacillus sp. Hm123]|uniref:ROK family glucokinase n=1 Tax=Bacillus sp. Hm123 TaxID=3450745 RepID=UPI003F443952